LVGGRLFSRPFYFEQFLRRNRSPRIHKTKSVEPQKSGNITHRLSLSARATQTREETIP
jgi:hypothetical protein